MKPQVILFTALIAVAVLVAVNKVDALKKIVNG